MSNSTGKRSNVSRQEVAFIVCHYLKQERFSKTLEVFREECKSLLTLVHNERPVKNLTSILNEYMHFKEQETRRHEFCQDISNHATIQKTFSQLQTLLGDYTAIQDVDKSPATEFTIPLTTNHLAVKSSEPAFPSINQRAFSIESNVHSSATTLSAPTIHVAGESDSNPSTYSPSRRRKNFIPKRHTRPDIDIFQDLELSDLLVNAPSDALHSEMNELSNPPLSHPPLLFLDDDLLSQILSMPQAPEKLAAGINTVLHKQQVTPRDPDPRPSTQSSPVAPVVIHRPPVRKVGKSNPPSSPFTNNNLSAPSQFPSSTSNNNNHGNRNESNRHSHGPNTYFPLENQSHSRPSEQNVNDNTRHENISSPSENSFSKEFPTPTTNIVAAIQPSPAPSGWIPVLDDVSQLGFFSQEVSRPYFSSPTKRAADNESSLNSNHTVASTHSQTEWPSSSMMTLLKSPERRTDFSQFFEQVHDTKKGGKKIKLALEAAAPPQQQQQQKTENGSLEADEKKSFPPAHLDVDAFLSKLVYD